MLDYTPRLVSLDAVRRDRKLKAAETDDDPLLLDTIAECSAAFQAACRRVFMPYVAAKAFGPAALRSSVTLKLEDDLLAVTALTNGDSAGITSGYSLRPDNSYPKRRIDLNSSGAVTWTFTDREDRVQVAGLWGYAPHYPRCWRDTGVDVPPAGLASGVTALALTVGQGASFEVGQYVHFGADAAGETALISAKPAADTLTLRRGELGTTQPANHLAGVDLYVFEPLPDVVGAVKEMVVYAYLHKDSIGSRVTVFDGGTVSVDDLDPKVQQAIDRHQFKHMPRAV